MQSLLARFHIDRVSRLISRLVLWGLALLLVIPLIPVVLWSITHSWFWPDLLPTLGTRAWKYVISPYSQIGDTILTTLSLAIFTTALTVLISLPAAKVIGQREFRGKSLLEILLLAPYLVSATSVAMGLYTIFIRLGLNNTTRGVMISMLIPTTPMMVRMLTSVFEAYNPEFEEQAKALGASPLRVMIHVTFPMILPGVVAGSLFTFLGAINAFFYPYLIGGGKVKMLAVLMYQFMGAGGYDLPITAAISLIMAVPGFLFLIFSDKLIKEEYFALGFGGGK